MFELGTYFRAETPECIILLHQASPSEKRGLRYLLRFLLIPILLYWYLIV